MWVGGIGLVVQWRLGLGDGDIFLAVDPVGRRGWGDQQAFEWRCMYLVCRDLWAGRSNPSINFGSFLKQEDSGKMCDEWECDNRKMCYKLGNLRILPSYGWVLVCILSGETLICYGG